MATTARAGLIRSQEHLLGLPRGCRGPSTWATVCCFPVQSRGAGSEVEQPGLFNSSPRGRPAAQAAALPTMHSASPSFRCPKHTGPVQARLPLTVLLSRVSSPRETGPLPHWGHDGHLQIGTASQGESREQTEVVSPRVSLRKPVPPGVRPPPRWCSRGSLCRRVCRHHRGVSPRKPVPPPPRWCSRGSLCRWVCRHHRGGVPKEACVAGCAVTTEVVSPRKPVPPPPRWCRQGSLCRRVCRHHRGVSPRKPVPPGVPSPPRGVPEEACAPGLWPPGHRAATLGVQQAGARSCRSCVQPPRGGSALPLPLPAGPATLPKGLVALSPPARQHPSPSAVLGTGAGPGTTHLLLYAVV
nr:DBF4-type zinc finger-containing protein 2 homolog [Oryctolagus cuniculus]